MANDIKSNEAKFFARVAAKLNKFKYVAIMAFVALGWCITLSFSVAWVAVVWTWLGAS